MKLQPQQKNIRLPKQWLHWAQTMGLKPMGRGVKGEWRGYYMIGRGRLWRVNYHGHFEVSCTIEHFDRWANSRASRLGYTPATMAQFQVAVKKLLRAARALPPEGGFESHQID